MCPGRRPDQQGSEGIRLRNMACRLHGHPMQSAGPIMLEVTTSLLEAGSPQVARPAPEVHPVSLHDMLSALNPLQYLPVIGTIYRTVTGDQISEPMRRIGSVLVSGLIGGPIGAVINIATIMAEKITGVDLDQTGQKLMTSNGVAIVGNPTPGLAQVVPSDPPAPLAPSPIAAWSSAELAASGVSTASDGSLKLANLSGAEVLNSLELSRIQMARSAYDRSMSLAI